MSSRTDIQWAHTTTNAVMGCHGCELYPTIAGVRATFRAALRKAGFDRPDVLALVDPLTARGPQHVKLNLKEICGHLAAIGSGAESGAAVRTLAGALYEPVNALYICYASTLHRTFNARGGNSGYAKVFEEPTLFAGRLARVARLGPPTHGENAAKPWLEGCPRMIFVSDMGDALCRNVSFEFLLKEIIEPVSSPEGQRHLWLWLSKRPHRMAEFSDWLAARNIAWPDNLVAMTSVTSAATVHRVSQLRRVAARYRALSVEPLWSDVDLPLDGIDWVIVGGQSGANTRPFDVDWARHIVAQCREVGASPFVKQLGANPRVDGKPLALVDRHGGDWNEKGWPADLRIRELPSAWRTASGIEAAA